MIDIYLELYNARLFPLRKRIKLGDANCKRPLHDNWPNANYSRERLEQYVADGHGLGWALGEEDLVIDVDAATDDRPTKQGVESLSKLDGVVKNLISHSTVVVESPSGGKHLYLTKPLGKIRKLLRDFPGIEFLSKGAYVVIAGSQHWQGGYYSWSDSTEFYSDWTRPQASVQLLQLLKRDVTELDDEESETIITAEQLRTLLLELDPLEYREQAEWFRLLCASHSATGGSGEGCDVFVEWSVSDPHYSGAEDSIRSRWSSLKSRHDGITIGTLFQELSRWGRREVVNKVRAQLDFDPIPVPQGPVQILYGLDEQRVNDQIINALGRSPNLFQRSGSLVSIADTHIQQLNAVNLCETISSVCSLVTVNASGQQNPVRIPQRVGQQIVGRGAWYGIPQLRGIVTTPVFTRAGLLQTPGYDPASGVYLKPTIEVPKVPESPSRSDAAAALARLKELVIDFPFLSPAHRSNWLAAMLTLVARHAIDGPVPLFLIDGNQAGIGKSLLVNLASTIAYGQASNNGPLSDDNEEVGKLLLSISMQGYGAYCFDNLKNGADFGCAALDAVLTGRSVSGRILGQSKVADAEIDTVFFATGNRVGISKESDSFRRVAIISLQSKAEDPKSRTNFRFGCDSQLLAYALEHRGSLLRDCLTVLQAASKHEMPIVKGWGSYSAFSDLIRRPLVWLGEPDPIESREDVLINSEDEEELSCVIGAIAHLAGVGTKLSVGELYSLLRAAADSMNGGEESLLAKAAMDVLAPDSYKEPARAMSKRLKTRFRDRPSGGLWIKSVKDAHKKQLVYGVEAV
jgi:hypothetical protein